jgi:hypothetical protein
MRRVFMLIACIGAGIILLRSWGLSHGPEETTKQPPAPLPTPTVREMPLVAGIPYGEAQAIVKRHRQELMKVSGVSAVGVGKSGILIEIFKPAAQHALPQTIEGLPVEVKLLPTLPPPSGVIVLQPGGRREHAESCPAGFQEVVVFDWRFCIEPGSSEPIPPLWVPPIAGIPYEEALKILDRHRDELMRLPGVDSVGMGADGIVVSTTNPAVVPSEIEGVPVRVEPSQGPAVGANHTQNTAVPLLHGGVWISGSVNPTTGVAIAGTLNGVALSEGKPWLILPTHLLFRCGSNPPCALASSGQPPLNSCSHTPAQPPSENIFQPPTSRGVGVSVRWSPLQLFANSIDTAAAFMDNDLVEGNGSLAADRKLEMWTEIQGVNFTGVDLPPMPEQSVFIVTAQLPHVYGATMQQTNITQQATFVCTGGIIHNLTDQIRLFVTSTFIQPGDSGAAVLDGNGNIVGMINYRLQSDARYGGGTRAPVIKQRIGFDQWYGTQTANDNSFGTFRPSQGRWYLDNGDGLWHGNKPGELQINYGTNGDRAISGSWNGGERCVGVYRPSQGRFYLDSNCDGVTDTTMTMGLAEDLPLAGDWNNDGKTDVGLWRPSTKTFYLDFNGNKVWEGCSVDKCFTYGFSTDKPVAGNWGGSPGNAAKTGVYRPSEGKWYLEKDNNGWQTGQEIVVGPFGLSDDKLVIGNWTGVGTKDKIGVFHTTGGGIVPPATWVLDNGDGAFTSYQREQRLGPFGLAEDQPVAWRKTVWKAN